MGDIRQAVSKFLVLVILGMSVTVNTASAQNSVPSPSLPDSPGAVAPATIAALQNAQPTTPAQNLTESSAQNATQPPASGNQKPSGTAAAEVPPPSGIAASSAAGAAIAPAKQRRVRTIVIGVAVIVAAAVAVGTVAALSSASPSRPPGTH